MGRDILCDLSLLKMSDAFTTWYDSEWVWEELVGLDEGSLYAYLIQLNTTASLLISIGVIHPSSKVWSWISYLYVIIFPYVSINNPLGIWLLVHITHTYIMFLPFWLVDLFIIKFFVSSWFSKCCFYSIWNSGLTVFKSLKALFQIMPAWFFFSFSFFCLFIMSRFIE